MAEPTAAAGAWSAERISEFVSTTCCVVRLVRGRSACGGQPATRAGRGPAARGGRRRQAAARRVLLLGLARGRAGRDTPAMRAAASMELVHAAALVHDDLIDDSCAPRGAQPARRPARAGPTPDADGGALAGDARRRPADGLGRSAVHRLRAARAVSRAREADVVGAGARADRRGVPGGAGTAHRHRDRPQDRWRSCATRPPSTPSSIRCRSAAGSAAPPSERSRALFSTGCRWGRRSSCATTCSRCSATRRHRQVEPRRPRRARPTALVACARQGPTPPTAMVLGRMLGRDDLGAADLAEIRAILQRSGSARPGRAADRPARARARGARWPAPPCPARPPRRCTTGRGRHHPHVLTRV